MADWAAIQAAIPAAVQQVLGPDFDADWHYTDSRYRDAEHCRIRLVSKSLLGRTENRISDNGDGTFTERSYSPTRLIVQFTFESQDQNLALSSIETASRVAGALRRSDVYSLLCAAGLGVSRVGPVSLVDYRDEHKRWRSASVFDVELNAHLSVVVREGTTSDYIDNVFVNGTAVSPIFISTTITLETGEPLLRENGLPLVTQG